MDSTKVTYEGIRENIVEYLSSNPTFKDYNFTAPAISTLIDALAYTSHYLMRYANFSVNEAFLDSAQLRKNVVSHAKELGYFPHQWSAAKAKLRLTVMDQTIPMDGVKVPKDTLFNATDDKTNKSYTFRTTEQYNFQRDDKGYWYADIDVVEGIFVTEKFKQDDYYSTRYFLINENVDTNYMSVIVYASESDKVGEIYTLVNDIESFDKESPIYYLYEAYNGKVEVGFGDGKLSKRVPPYSIITVKYLVTNGSAANNIIRFVLANNIGELAKKDIKLEVLIPSESGGERESIESIRFNAPKFYQSQDRAVTTTDYNVLLLNKFGSWIDSVVSWGGEEDTPPAYGSVLMCIRPKYTDTLSPSQKTEISNYLEKKNLPCIDVRIVDPSYIDVLMNMSVIWNPMKTTKTKTELTNILEKNTQEFFKTNATSFKSKFQYSKFLTTLTSLDHSIDSILTDVKLKQTILPENINLKISYLFEFCNKIKKGSVNIGPWKQILDSNNTYYISDKNEDGILYLTKTDGTIYEYSSVGTVNYESGEIFIDSYNFSTVSNITSIPVVCEPLLDNLYVIKKHLLRLHTLNISIDED